MLYVMAGSYSEFITFINHHKLKSGSEARYINGIQSIRGRERGSQFIRIGSWWNRADGDEIFDSMVMMGWQEIETMVEQQVRNLVLIFNSGKSWIKRLDTSTR